MMLGGAGFPPSTEPKELYFFTLSGYSVCILMRNPLNLLRVHVLTVHKCVQHICLSIMKLNFGSRKSKLSLFSAFSEQAM